MSQLHFRMANETDVDLYYQWVNDEVVRQNAFSQDKIEYDAHVNWFSKRVRGENCFMYLFYTEPDKYVGQIRIENNNNEMTIDISIDKTYRGKGFGTQMLKIAIKKFFVKKPSYMLYSYIKEENIASISSFKKAHFHFLENLIINGISTQKYFITKAIFINESLHSSIK